MTDEDRSKPPSGYDVRRVAPHYWETFAVVGGTTIYPERDEAVAACWAHRDEGRALAYDDAAVMLVDHFGGVVGVTAGHVGGLANEMRGKAAMLRAPRLTRIIEDLQVICDDSNNPPSVRDAAKIAEGRGDG